MKLLSVQFFLVFGFVCLFFGGCSTPLKQEDKKAEILTTLEERDLIPEGTAYDPKTGLVFISSIYKRKIVAIRKDGTHYDFTKEAQDDLWSTLGMEVDTHRNLLWVISGKGKEGLIPHIPVHDSVWEAKLYCYATPSGTLLKVYTVMPEITESFCFNDLTVLDNGDVYLTESIQNKIYVLEKDSRDIKFLIQPTGHTFLNGITHTPDGKRLFVSSTEGIISIEIESVEHKALPYPFTTQPRPIDGLAFYDNSLIGHQSIRVTRFYLNEKSDSILRHEVIDSMGLDGSTTGETGIDGWYYYIGNSQIRSGVNYKTLMMQPWDSLEQVVIKKVLL
jgi:hypothetical protein